MTFSFPAILITCILIAIIFAIIMVSYWKSQRDRLSDLSPEQRQAIRLQNKALGLWILAILGGVLVPTLLGMDLDSFPKEIKAFAITGYVLLGGAILVFIAINSIISRVSILHPRCQWEYSKDEEASYMGKAVLLVLAGALLFWFISKYGQ